MLLSALSPVWGLPKAWESFKAGRYTDAANQASASIPMIGPAAQHASERWKSGDVAGGVWETLGLVTAPFLPGAAGKVGAAVKPRAMRASESAWLRAADLSEALLKKTNTYRKTQDLSAAAHEVAGTVLDAGHGPLTARNAAAMRAELNTAGAAARDLKAQSPASIDLNPILTAADEEARRIGRGPMSNADVAQAQKLGDELLQQPDTIPVPEAAGALEEIYQTNTYGADRVDPVRTRMDKAVGRAYKDEMNRVVPGLAEANARYSALKPAAAAVGRGVRRAGRQPIVSMGDLAGIGAMQYDRNFWPVLAASLASRPLPMSSAAQVAFSSAKVAPQAMSAATRGQILAGLLSPKDQ
jgi:hypothetical protein